MSNHKGANSNSNSMNITPANEIKENKNTCNNPAVQTLIAQVSSLESEIIGYWSKGEKLVEGVVFIKFFFCTFQFNFFCVV